MIRLHADLRHPSWSKSPRSNSGLTRTPQRQSSDSACGSPHPRWSQSGFHDHTASPIGGLEYEKIVSMAHSENQFKHDSWISPGRPQSREFAAHWPTARLINLIQQLSKDIPLAARITIYLDVDGDGQFRSAREIAQSLGKTWLDSRANKPEDPGTQALQEISHALGESHASVRDQFAELASTKIEDYSNWMTGLSPTLKSQLEPFHRAWQQSVRVRRRRNKQPDQLDRGTQLEELRCLRKKFDFWRKPDSNSLKVGADQSK